MAMAMRVDGLGAHLLLTESLDGDGHIERWAKKELMKDKAAR